MGAGSASAALSGPVYPVPGHAGAGHGGNTCQSSTDVEAASGKTGGMTWSFGGGTATDPSPGCTFANPQPALPDFDTTRWERLYWGADASNATTKMPQLALDGTIDAAGETLSLVPDDGTPGGTDSELAVGKVVWAGSTSMSWCNPTPSCVFATSTVQTRFTLRITDINGAPVPLVTPAAAGAAEPNAGGLVQVTESLKKFKANLLFEAQNPSVAGNPYQPAIEMYNSLNHPQPAPTPQTWMSFTGGFRYENRAPVADFTFPTPQNGQEVTFTSTSTDPDGTVDGYAWDLNGDNGFGDATGPTASGTYGPGTHTVRLRVTDNDGTQSTVVSKTFTIAAPPAGNTGGNTGGSGGPVGGTGGPVADQSAPLAKIAFAKSKLKAALKKGLKGTLTSNEAGRATLSVTLPAKLAKKLKLKGAVGKATVTISAAGKKAFTVKFSKKAARKLKKLKKVSVKVAGTMTDAAGNARPVQASVSLKR